MSIIEAEGKSNRIGIAQFRKDWEKVPSVIASPKLILAFGETLWDLLPGGPALGGAPFNFAYRANSLGDRGLIVTRLGEDDFGKKAFDRIVELGMETRFVQRDARHPTGTVEITLDAQRNPDYFIVPQVAYDFIEPTPELLKLAGQADCLCFGTLVQRAPQTRAALRDVIEAAPAALKLLDINLRKDCFTLETITESLRRADILKMNIDEARLLSEMLGVPMGTLREFCAAMNDRWALQCCLVTLGERGALAVSRDGKKAYAPGYKVELIDPCGSGDAFTAGFVHEYLRQAALEACCQLGNGLGALVAAQAGATVPIAPSQIEDFLHRSQERMVEPSLKTLLFD